MSGCLQEFAAVTVFSKLQNAFAWVASAMGLKDAA